MIVERSTINERVAKIRAELCDNNNIKFAAALGISPQNASGMVTGKRNVSDKIKEQILEVFPEVSKIWLYAGAGEMMRNAPVINQHNVNGQNISGQNVEVNNPTPTEVERLLNHIEFLQRQIDGKDTALVAKEAELAKTKQELAQKDGVIASLTNAITQLSNKISQ